MKIIYIVKKNADSCEGRGPMSAVCAFTNKDAAKEAADSMEPYGHSGQFCTVENFALYDTAKEFFDIEESETREAALKKLTKRERRALGL